MANKFFLTTLLVLLSTTCKPYEGGILEEASSADDKFTSATIALDRFGELKIILPSDLAQEKISTAQLNFLPGGDDDDSMYSSFILGTADADNVTSPVKSEESATLISEISIDILLADETSLCPDGSFIVELVSSSEVTDEIVLGQTDVACAGNRFSKINNLVTRITEMTTGSSFAFTSNTKDFYGDTYNEAKSFVEQETDGFFKKYADKDLTKKFLLHYKMLDGYHQMRQALKFPDADPTIEGGWTDRLYEFIGENASEKDHQNIPHGIIIPSLLNGFLNPQVNMISLGNQVDSNEDLETRVTKQALQTAVARFLHYQYIFDDNDIFDNATYSQKFNNIDWHSSLRGFVQQIVDKINKGHQEINSNAEARAESKLTINEIHGDLNKKIQELYKFMYDSQQSGKGCKDVLASYYPQFATPLKDGTTSDAFVLLNSKDIMYGTGIHEPCKKYGDSFDIKLNHKRIKDAVVAAKEATFGHIKKLNDNFKDRNKGDFLVTFVKKNYNALVPVLTEDTTQIAGLVDTLRESERKAIKERRQDQFWRDVLGWFNVIVTALGIVASIALFASAIIFPPFAAVASVVLGLSIAAGATLTVMYSWNYLQERGRYHELERQIFSGANADTSEAARSYSQWRKAKFAAITEGVFTGVAIAGGGLRFVANPQAGVRGVTSTAGKAKDYWKGLREAKKSKDLAKVGFKEGIKNKYTALKGVPKGIKELGISGGKGIGRNVKGGVLEFKNIKANYRETWKAFGDWKELRKLAKEHGGTAFKIRPDSIEFTGKHVGRKSNFADKMTDIWRARGDGWKMYMTDDAIKVFRNTTP